MTMATASSAHDDTMSDFISFPMHAGADEETRRIPSLLQLCQRVAASHVERLDSIGELRVDLVMPMLERCSPDTLLRLEQASPELLDATSEIWKHVCFRTYPLAAQSMCMRQEPESWRDSFFVIREREARRFEDLGLRLRTQREEAEQRKKEGQVKFTDRLPPAKRRGWGPAPPKTLIQKTRSDAAKLHKGIYGAGRRLPMLSTKMQGPVTSGSSSQMLASPLSRTSSTTPATSGSRVTVMAVNVRRNSSTTTTTTLQSAPRPSAAISRAHAVVTHSEVSPLAKHQRTSVVSGVEPVPLSPNSLKQRTTPLKPPLPKRDPKASLFMPKHRVPSQLPTASSGVRSKS